MCSSIRCCALAKEAYGANHVSLTASLVPSEACGVHPTFTLSFASEETCRDPHVLPVVLTICLKGNVELIMY